MGLAAATFQRDNPASPGNPIRSGATIACLCRPLLTSACLCLPLPSLPASACLFPPLPALAREATQCRRGLHELQQGKVLNPTLISGVPRSDHVEAEAGDPGIDVLHRNDAACQPVSFPASQLASRTPVSRQEVKFFG